MGQQGGLYEAGATAQDPAAQQRTGRAAVERQRGERAARTAQAADPDRPELFGGRQAGLFSRTALPSPAAAGREAAREAKERAIREAEATVERLRGQVDEKTTAARNHKAAAKKAEGELRTLEADLKKAKDALTTARGLKLQ